MHSSLGRDLIFSNLPCAHNNPCLSFEEINFLSNLSLSRVCWLHLNSQHSACNGSFRDITSQFFTFVLAQLINLETYAMTFLVFLNVEHEFIKCSMIGFSSACVSPTET